MLSAAIHNTFTVASYESDPRKWVEGAWIDRYSGEPYRIATHGEHGTLIVARVKTYCDVLKEYEYHPESRCVDSNDKPCSRQTVGLLRRRCIRSDGLRYIGKEANKLEEVEAGVIQDAREVYSECRDLRRSQWNIKFLPVVKSMRLRDLQNASGLSRAALQAPCWPVATTR